MNDSILTITELHLYLKIPKQTLYALAQQGRIPAAKIGKHWRFQKSSIDRWMRSQHRVREHQLAGIKSGNGNNN
ncbi:MAG: helix-turn-helix domain-containing protein [Candidatus Omnitrophica bacterium]|nr:helix-turn-helix domain-containing protein [Candidatus Omnitrophota bacterium]